MSEDTTHGQPGTEVATVDEERYPVPDPGLEPHLPRLTDVDEKAADRATRQVATFFGLVPVLAIGFAVVYFAVPGDAYIDFGPLRANTRNLLLGLTFGFALLFLGVGAVQWARKLMDDKEMIDYRHGASSSDDDKTYMVGLMGQAKSRAVSIGKTSRMTKAPSRNGMITRASKTCREKYPVVPARQHTGIIAQFQNQWGWIWPNRYLLSSKHDALADCRAVLGKPWRGQ